MHLYYFPVILSRRAMGEASKLDGLMKDYFLWKLQTHLSGKDSFLTASAGEPKAQFLFGFLLAAHVWPGYFPSSLSWFSLF